MKMLFLIFALTCSACANHQQQHRQGGLGTQQQGGFAGQQQGGFAGQQQGGSNGQQQGAFADQQQQGGFTGQQQGNFGTQQQGGVGTQQQQQQQQCPPFGQFNQWTDQCLWFPINNMRDDIADACNITFNTNTTNTNTTTNTTTNAGGFSDLMPPGFVMPERCGQCSFKFRCRNRQATEGCLAVDGERTTCTQYGQICDLPPAPVVGCKWGMFAEAFKACTFRPDIPDWRRQAYKNFLSIMPEGNCIEQNGRCKCCCHPYQPNAQGTACVKVEETKTCQAFNTPNEWSQCLWFPVSNIINGFKNHCDLDYKGDIPSVVPTPAGFTLPDKCGMCSFRIRCSKREKQEGCFHIDVDKKACNGNDCPGCGDVCTIPYVNGTNCNWTQFIGQSLVKKVEAMTTGANLPYWRKRGMKDLLKNLPYGKCKDINGQCKCCCHPYEPSADGTQCVLADVCTF